MTPRFGQFPFCNVPVMDSVQQIQGTYPVAYTAAQITDTFLNVKKFHFDISAIQDPLDANLDIVGAMAALNIGQIAALGIAIDPLTHTNRVAVVGDMIRRDDGTCNGISFVYNHDLCYMEINLRDTVRRQAGSSSISQLYYPRFTTIFYASNYVFSNDVTLLFGAGTIVGGIDVAGSSGVITDLYVVSASGPPVGQPSVVGQGFQISERFDNITFTRQGNKLIASGVTFEDIQSVSIGYKPATFTVVAVDKLSITVDIPVEAVADPIVFRTSRDFYTTRMPFIPL